VRRGAGRPVTFTPSDLVEMRLEASRALDEAQAELIRATREDAAADRRYRQSKSNAYLASSGTVGEREATVNKTAGEEGYAAHLAEGLAKAALENVRNKRGQLSALQSIAGAVKAEAELARVGGGP
jgi:hypothetical protein